MSLRKRGPEGIYHGIFYVNGKKIWRSLDTSDREEAKKLYQKKYEELRLAADPSKPRTWGQFKKEYNAHFKANFSRDAYRALQTAINHFERLVAPDSPADLLASLERFKQLRVQEGKEKSTVNRHLGSLKAMANFAMEAGQLPWKNLRTIHKLKETKTLREYYEPKAINQLREKLEADDVRDKIKQKLRIIIELGLYTGFRAKEMAQLKWVDIDFDREFVEVKSGEGRTIKDYEERRIKLHPKLKAHLLEWRKLCKSLFVLEGMRAKSVSRKFTRFIQRVGAAGSLHSLRHTFITHLVRKVGSDPAKEAAGHSTVRTTERYSHQKSEIVAIDKLDY